VEGFDLGYIGDTCVDSGSNNVTSGDVCPRGHFCAEGTSSPIPCAEGTFNPSRGATSSEDCQPCTGKCHALGFVGLTGAHVSDVCSRVRVP
jgi:hypothetical protein